jgi:hypothetical protein
VQVSGAGQKKQPTGDPNCPPHIRSAKCIYHLIVKATDGSDGQSGDDNDPSPNDDDNDDDDNDNNEDNKEDDKDDKANDKNCGQVESVNLSFDDVSDFTVEGEPSAVRTTMRTSITVALVSEASRGGKKWSSALKGGGGGTTKKSKALSKPLRIPRKSPTSESNDGDGDGFNFARVMGMMMIQNRLDNKQRERQYKSESEQREQEYQLCWEEMAIAREEAWA